MSNNSNGSVVALDPGSGRVVWRASDDSSGASIAVSGNLLFVGIGNITLPGIGAQVTVLNALSGALVRAIPTANAVQTLLVVGNRLLVGGCCTNGFEEYIATSGRYLGTFPLAANAMWMLHVGNQVWIAENDKPGIFVMGA